MRLQGGRTGRYSLIMYNIRSDFVVNIQTARDLNQLKPALLAVLDSLFVDIVNQARRAEKAEAALGQRLTDLEHRVAGVEASLATIEDRLRRK